MFYHHVFCCSYFHPEWSLSIVFSYTCPKVVRYQCDETYNGTPSATCGYDAEWQMMSATMSYLIETLQPTSTQDGQYVAVGRCRKECLGTLPVVPFAAPKASEPPPEGWLSGLGSRMLLGRQYLHLGS